MKLIFEQRGQIRYELSKGLIVFSIMFNFGMLARKGDSRDFGS